MPIWKMPICVSNETIWGKDQQPFYADGSLDDQTGSAVAMGVVNIASSPSVIYTFGYDGGYRYLKPLLGQLDVTEKSRVIDNASQRTRGTYGSVLLNEKQRHYSNLHHKKRLADIEAGKFSAHVTVSEIDRLRQQSLTSNMVSCVSLDDESYLLELDAFEEEHEKALALGFRNVAEMQRHQQWLDKQREHQEAVKAAVNEANETGSSVIALP